MPNNLIQNIERAVAEQTLVKATIALIDLKLETLCYIKDYTAMRLSEYIDAEIYINRDYKVYRRCIYRDGETSEWITVRDRHIALSAEEDSLEVVEDEELLTEYSMLCLMK